MSKFGKAEYVELHGEFKHETAKAYLVILTNGEEIWAAKSNIEPGTRVPGIGETGPFSMAEWVVKKNGWLEKKTDDEIPF